MATDGKRLVDSVSGTETTGHEWDGIRELDTPLPLWWRWIFYATVVWSIGYWIAMPAWPMLSGYTAGILGYSSRAALQEDLKDARAVGNAAEPNMLQRVLDDGYGRGDDLVVRVHEADREATFVGERER